MTTAQEIFSFSEWLQILQDLNFRESDVQLVKDRLRFEFSNDNRRFRFLDGSSRKSPRFRCRDGAGIIVQYLGNRRHLARISIRRTPPSNADFRLQRVNPALVPEPVKFVLFDENDASNPRTIFEWHLVSQGHSRSFEVIQGHSRSPDVSFCNTSSLRDQTVNCDIETVVSVNFHLHFESYSSCRKRFVVIVGPPFSNSNQPTNCVFDAENETMKVFHLRSDSSGEEASHRWAANVSFNPRPSGEQVAAMIVCRTKSDHLPRSGQTGSLILYDFRKEKVLHELTCAHCHSSGLQHTCSGEHLLTSLVGDDDVGISGTSKDDVIARKGRRCRRIAMLSADDLTFLRVFPVFLVGIKFNALDAVLSSALSMDRRKVALFMRNDNNNNNNNNDNNDDDYDICRSCSRESDYYSLVDVVLIHFPTSVRSLQRICLEVVEKSFKLNSNNLQSLYSPTISRTFFDKLGVGNSGVAKGDFGG